MKTESFPTEKAISIIERDLERPLGAVFAEFDPKPIGSDLRNFIQTFLVAAVDGGHSRRIRTVVPRHDIAIAGNNAHAFRVETQNLGIAP